MSKWPRYYKGDEGSCRVNPYGGNVVLDTDTLAEFRPSVARRIAAAILRAADEAEKERER